MATKTPKFGLDAEIAAKTAAKYSPQREQQASQWIEAVTGCDMSSGFQPSLKSGVTLCKLVNTIWPGKVKKVHQSKMPFFQRENIVAYLEACRSLGMIEVDLFVTQDLFEGDNLLSVVDNVHALGSYAQKSGFNGPKVGLKLADQNKRNFTNEQLNKYVPSRVTQGSAGCEVERNPQIKGQIVKDVTGHKASGAMTRQTYGSYGHEVKRNPQISGQIVKDVSGHKASSIPTKVAQGSYGVVDNSKDVRLDNIVRDVDYIKKNIDARGAEPKPAAPSGGASGGFCGECGSKRASGGSKFCGECGNRF